jgi:hypothetical protein
MNILVISGIFWQCAFSAFSEYTCRNIYIQDASCHKTTFFSRLNCRGENDVWYILALFSSQYTLQMKSRWESNINVWFPFMYSQNWNCYFQNRIIMFCLPVPTLLYVFVRDLYISSIDLPILLQGITVCGLILGRYKSLSDTWMWIWGLRPRNSQKRNT